MDKVPEPVRTGLDLAYRVLDEIVPFLACQHYGHPHQPRWFLRRFRRRPWRCDQCGTWWVTKRESSMPYGDPIWVWDRTDVIFR